MESPAAPLLRHLLAPIDEWLSDPATEEVAINRPGEVWVRRHGAFERYEIPLAFEDLESIAILAGALRHQDIDSESPLLATELPDGERLQVCLPPCVPIGTVSLTIRRHARSVAPLSAVGDRYRAARWNEWRSLRASRDMTGLLALYDAGDLEGFLRAAVGARLNMLLAGATGSGKTTLSKTLIGAIAPSERIITIEDTLELIVTQPNHVRLLYSKACPVPRHGEGLSRATTDANSLLEASLRMRPDRVLLQELRDDAAWVYINEVVSGHPGSVTTIHGHGAADAVRRLFALVKASGRGSALEDRTVADLLDGAIDVIVPLREDGGVFDVGSVWFCADAARRGEPLSSLLRGG